MRLQKVISGGQTGSDAAGVYVAALFGLKTGGIMPAGFRTLSGPNPEFAAKYGLTEHTSSNYVPRTYLNVQNADATVRLAGDFGSRGEICTLRAIQKFDKHHFDVDLADPPPESQFLEWLEEKKVVTLNVAGNAEQTYNGAFHKTVQYLASAFFLGGLSLAVRAQDMLTHLHIFYNEPVVVEGQDDIIFIRKQERS